MGVKAVLRVQSTNEITFVKEGVLQGSTFNLDNLNGIKISGLFQPENCINSHLGEEVFVGRQDLGAEGCPGDVHQVFLELFRVGAVIVGLNKEQE